METSIQIPPLPEAALRESAARILTEAGRHLGSGEVRRIDLVRELRRRYSHLVWLRFDCVGGEKTLVFKVRLSGGATVPRGNLGVEFGLMNELRDVLAPHRELKTLETVAYHADLDVLVTVARAGENLADLLRRKARWIPDRSMLGELEKHCERAGRWLRTFQDRMPVPGERYASKPLIDDIRLRLDLLSSDRARGMGPDLRSRVLECVERIVEALGEEDARVCRMHGDFCPGNVLVSPDEMVVFDFVRSGYGSVYHDPTRFDHQLRLLSRKMTYLPATIEGLRSAFASGYGESLEPDRGIVKLFRIRHLVCHWLGRVRAEGRTLAARFFDGWVCRRHRSELEALLGD